jgi:hypothetical protein
MARWPGVAAEQMHLVVGCGQGHQVHPVEFVADVAPAALDRDELPEGYGQVIGVRVSSSGL